MADEQPTNGKLAWFEKKIKAKLTVLCAALITVAFYAVVVFGLPLDYFSYYAGFITLNFAGYTAADVANTKAFLKQKEGSNGGAG